MEPGRFHTETKGNWGRNNGNVSLFKFVWNSLINSPRFSPLVFFHTSDLRSKESASWPYYDNGIVRQHPEILVQTLRRTYTRILCRGTVPLKLSLVLPLAPIVERPGSILTGQFLWGPVLEKGKPGWSWWRPWVVGLLWIRSAQCLGY